MRLVAWPTRWNEDEGWQPINAQELELRATPTELRDLASFLIETAKQLEDSANGADEIRAGLEFADCNGGGCRSSLRSSVSQRVPNRTGRGIHE